ncbi:MAG: ABC transporter permease [Bacteroidota bacterium]|nr:ABC transporter permease [Bacteroidota bacterium]
MLKYLIEKEFKQIFRNPVLPRLILVFPFVVLAIFPLVANFEVKDLNLCVVDNSHSGMSDELIRKIVASDYFRLTETAASYREALKYVEQNQADVILEIPAGFERDLLREGSTSVMISANAVNGVKGSICNAYLSYIILDYNNRIRTELMPENDGQIQGHLQIVPQFLFNPELKYPLFMIPALMVMMLTMICGFLPALNIVLEKEKGTIEQLNVTPVNKFVFILSKLIPYWIIGFVVLTICFGVAWLFYRLKPAGSLLTIYLFVSVFVLAFSGFGLVISTYANTLQQAMFMMFFFVVTFIFLSGLYTPVSNMPRWGRVISVFSPLKYLMEVMRLVYLKGSGFQEMTGQFMALCGFAVLFNGWAVLNYRKQR